jgi:hypothetical protein
MAITIMNSGSARVGETPMRRFGIGLLALIAAYASSVGVGKSGEDTGAKQKAVKIIRQGGYVEKVEPGVDYEDRLPRFAPKETAASLEQFRIIPDLGDDHCGDGHERHADACGRRE